MANRKPNQDNNDVRKAKEIKDSLDRTLTDAHKYALLQLEKSSNKYRLITVIVFTIGSLGLGLVGFISDAIHLWSTPWLQATLDALMADENRSAWILGLSTGVLFAIIAPLLAWSISFNKTTQKARQKYKGLSIVGILLRRKHSTLLITASVLSIAFVVSLFFIGNSALASFSLILLILVAVRAAVLGYRVRKGWYGDNEYEMREIIQFIIDNSQGIDFTDDGKPKRIITDEDMEQFVVRVEQSLAGSRGVV